MTNKESSADYYHRNKKRLTAMWKTDEGRAKRREYREKYRKKYPQKERAHQAIGDAVYRKKMPPAKDCVCVCGKQADTYHHHAGYEKENRMNVIPLCNGCHKEEHKMLRQDQMIADKNN